MREEGDITPELVVFDLGGTTVHDRGEVSAAFESALRGAGIALSPRDLAAWRGGSKREALRRLLAPAGEGANARADEVYAVFQADLAARFARAGPLSLPGVRQTIDRLHASGIRVAVASGFDRCTAELILGAVDWADRLDARVCSEDVALGRPAPYMIFRAMEWTGVLDVGRVAIVGDTVRDLEAGRNGGVAYRVGVLTGAHDRATLSAGPHTHIVDSVRDIPLIWTHE